MATDNDPSAQEPRILEIEQGRQRRMVGLLAYLLLFAIVAAVLVVMFVQFTASLRVALVLVLFMVSYMGIMGWIASRDINRRE